MKYMLLIYLDEKTLATMPEAERGKLAGEYGAFSAAIKESGNFVGGDALLPSSTATTVRLQGGRVVTTDGPYAETKEQLGGYYAIEARNLDEATSIAARIPSVKVGAAIEIRPIMTM
jgi:hypothetical protein